MKNFKRKISVFISPLITFSALSQTASASPDSTKWSWKKRLAVGGAITGSSFLGAYALGVLTDKSNSDPLPKVEKQSWTPEECKLVMNKVGKRALQELELVKEKTGESFDYYLKTPKYKMGPLTKAETANMLAVNEKFDEMYVEGWNTKFVDTVKALSAKVRIRLDYAESFISSRSIALNLKDMIIVTKDLMLLSLGITSHETGKQDVEFFRDALKEGARSRGFEHIAAMFLPATDEMSMDAAKKPLESESELEKEIERCKLWRNWMIKNAFNGSLQNLIEGVKRNPKIEWARAGYLFTGIKHDWAVRNHIFVLCFLKYDYETLINDLEW